MVKKPLNKAKQTNEENVLRSFSELTFRNMEDAINNIKRKCKNYNRFDYPLAAGKRFPEKLKKHISKMNTWLIIFPGYKRKCWIISDIGNKFVDSSMEAVAFYIPAGHKYSIIAVGDIFYTQIEESK